MNVRVQERSPRSDSATGRSPRSDSATGRSPRSDRKSERRRTRRGSAASSRTGREVAVRNHPGAVAPASTTAAQRAYQRRQQRAAAHSGDPAALAALPKRRTRFAERIPFVASIIGLLSCGLVLTLLLTTRAAEDSYQLSAARAHNQRLAEEKSALQRDVETANSAPDLAAKARNLGMIPAKDPARLVVGPDGGVVVVGKPTPAQGAPVPLLNGQAPQNTALGNSRNPAATPSGTPTPPGAPQLNQLTPVPPPSAAPQPNPAPQLNLAPQPNPALQPNPAPQPNPGLPPNPAPQPSPAPRLPATPQPGNGGRVQAQGEQLVPMAIPDGRSAGSAPGAGQVAGGPAPSAQTTNPQTSGNQAAAQAPSGQPR